MQIQFIFWYWYLYADYFVLSTTSSLGKLFIIPLFFLVLQGQHTRSKNASLPLKLSKLPWKIFVLTGSIKHFKYMIISLPSFSSS